MRNQKGFTLIELVIVLCIVVFGIGGTVGWVMNIMHLANCDFEAPYKSEIIYGVGTVVPPVGAITGYMDLGK